MEQFIKTGIINYFKNVKTRINKNEYLTPNDITNLLHDCHYNIHLIYYYDLLNELSKEEIQLIIGIFIFLTNENIKNTKNVLNELRTKLNDKPKDNYDNMSKEELITLLRNK